jgi:hypothetical protein
MKSAIFSALALLAGCGYHSSNPYGYQYPNQPVQNYPNQPAGISAFVVDVGAGVVADPNTYGITTDGNIWRLTWLGDAFRHNFHGTITCANGCLFDYARVENTKYGDTVIVDRDVVTFDAVTNAARPQTLDISAPYQPFIYDLFIDGVEAVGSVVFQSYQVRSTTDEMPFALYSSDQVGYKAEGKTTLAPQFISQLPKDSTAGTFTVAPPARQSNELNNLVAK